MKFILEQNSMKILNQWSLPECSSFSVISALMRMKNIDSDKLIQEMTPDFWRLITTMQVWQWMKKHWYIKYFVPYRYSKLLLPRIPLVARVYNVDWEATNKPPFKLVAWPANKNAHYVCITDKWTCVNSWWEEWGDKWYFYFDDSQLSHFSMIRRIII